MLRFFRRMRQKLIDTGSVTKYLLYAAGEVLLVVIGILIALQVNNWNEERKKHQVTENILRQIQADLLTDINNINTDYRLARNELNIQEILDKHVNREYTQENLRPFYYNILNHPWGVEINTRGYEKLLDHLAENAGSYNDLLLNMDVLYNEQGQDMLDQKVEMERLSQRYLEYLNYESGLLGALEGSDRWTEFVLNSPIFRGHVLRVRLTLGRLLWNYRKYRHLSVLLYKDIGKRLGEESDYHPLIRDFYMDLPPDSLPLYAGVYKLWPKDQDEGVDSLVITVSNSLLQVQNYFDYRYGFRRDSTRAIYAFTDSTFYLDGNMYISMDKKGELKVESYWPGSTSSYRRIREN